MKKIIIKTFILFVVLGFWLLLLNSLLGATYYVDYVSGVDTANGLTTATAWKHIPGDQAATSNANITLAAGDTVVLHGGITYALASNQYIEINNSGTVSNPITYISGERYSTPWGSTAAEINCTAFTLNWPSAVYLANKSYIVWDGIRVYNGPSSQDAGHIGGEGSAWSNILIKNTEIGPGLCSGLSFRGTYDEPGPYPGSLTVTNCHIHDLTDGHGVFSRWGMTNLLVVNSLLHDIGAVGGDDPIGLFGVGAGSTHILRNTIIRGNEMYNVPIKSYVIQSANVVDLIIEQNYFHGGSGYSGIDINGPTTNMIIRNNLFVCTLSNFFGAIVFSTDKGSYTPSPFCDGVKIYNNTFSVNVLRDLYLEDALIFFSPGDSPNKPNFRNIDIRNNIIEATANTKTMIYVASDGAGSPIVDLATFTSDYNTYNWQTTSEEFGWNGVAKTFAQWKTTTGGDSHSTASPVTFISSSDFHLSGSDTVALNKGVTISEVNNDKDNISRPQGIAYDIGAYEFIESAISILAPLSSIILLK